ASRDTSFPSTRTRSVITGSRGVVGSPRVSYFDLVLTLVDVSSMKRGSPLCLRNLQPRPRKLRRGGGERDPRGQRSPSSLADHAWGGVFGQFEAGARGGGQLVHPVLPLAQAGAALWARWPAAPADSTEPLAAPSDARSGACRGGVRAPVAD